MMVPNRSRGFFAAISVTTAIGAAFLGCIDRPAKPVTPVQQSGITEEIHNEGLDKVDLLMMVDNSNSMRDNQTFLMAQFRTMIETLVNPLCISAADSNPHACVAGTDDHPQYPPVADLHVGVVDSDLGTPGSSVPGCADTMYGDDGLLNPIHAGPALSHHEPWTMAPTSFGRPMDCSDPNEYPAFITFESGAANDPNCTPDTTCTGDADSFVHHFQCNAGLYVNGCGLEQQLESVWRAIIWHDAREYVGNMDPNAGFLRDNALLAMVFVTDEEDGSVRNPTYQRDTPGSDATDVFNASSTRWSNSNLNLRDYMYQPGGDQDPTWPLERYIDPTNAAAGFLGLKPDHPERVLFAAIAGVPLGTGGIDASGNLVPIDWDFLLGAPVGGADNFIGRDTSMLTAATDSRFNSHEGPISMMQANLDALCPERVVPACRREGTTYSPTACTTDLQYFAWPSRRIIEVARRFDQAQLCNGRACNNGIVSSICSTDYSSAMRAIILKIQQRLSGRCLPRHLDTAPDAAGDLTVQCVISEQLAADAPDMCDMAHGRVDPGYVPASGTTPAVAGTVTHVTLNGMMYRVCNVLQVPVCPPRDDVAFPATGYPMGCDDTTVGHPAGAGHGWYYDTTPDASGNQSCAQRITFTDNDGPSVGSTTHLECIQSSTAVATDAGPTG